MSLLGMSSFCEDAHCRHKGVSEAALQWAERPSGVCRRSFGIDLGTDAKARTCRETYMPICWAMSFTRPLDSSYLRSRSCQTTGRPRMSLNRIGSCIKAETIRCAVFHNLICLILKNVPLRDLLISFTEIASGLRYKVISASLHAGIGISRHMTNISTMSCLCRVTTSRTRKCGFNLCVITPQTKTLKRRTGSARPLATSFFSGWQPEYFALGEQAASFSVRGECAAQIMRVILIDNWYHLVSSSSSSCCCVIVHKLSSGSRLYLIGRFRVAFTIYMHTYEKWREKKEELIETDRCYGGKSAFPSLAMRLSCLSRTKK